MRLILHKSVTSYDCPFQQKKKLQDYECGGKNRNRVKMLFSAYISGALVTMKIQIKQSFYFRFHVMLYARIQKENE